MTVLRCTAKLLKRLKLPAKPPEPAPAPNPLGEWYADLDFWNRKPYVVMLNGATGAVLTLNGNAAGLRVLHERALLQFASLCAHFGIQGPLVDAELLGFHAGFTHGATRDRSLLASLNQVKYGAWMGFEHSGYSLAQSAMNDWEGLFRPPSLGTSASRRSGYHVPLDLLRSKLMPAGAIPPIEHSLH